MADEYLVIAEVLKPQGLRGQVKARPKILADTAGLMISGKMVSTLMVKHSHL